MGPSLSIAASTDLRHICHGELAGVAEELEIPPDFLQLAPSRRQRRQLQQKHILDVFHLLQFQHTAPITPNNHKIDVQFLVQLLAPQLLYYTPCCVRARSERKARIRIMYLDINAANTGVVSGLLQSTADLRERIGRRKATPLLLANVSAQLRGQREIETCSQSPQWWSRSSPHPSE